MRGILRFCRADPLRIVVGTAVLAAIVSLDGDGSTTFMITVSAMLPLYRRLGMSVVVLTGVAATANGVMNTLPWGGPTARAATALHLDAGDIFVPMIPALAVGLLCVLVLSYALGLRERRRLGTLTFEGADDREPQPEPTDETETALVGAGAGAAAAGTGRLSLRKSGGRADSRPTPAAGGAAPGLSTPSQGASSSDSASGAESAVLDPDRATLRPKLYWFNAALTVALLVLLITQLLPIPVLFLLGAAIALTVNFRDMADQKARIAAHSENVLNVAGMVFAAAVFTGVLTGTGMVDEMARTVVNAIPDALGPHMAVVTGILSIPFTYLMSNDGFYFGIVPILSEAGAAHGVSSLEIARASLVGQPLHMSSPLVPAVYVLVGMAKVEFGEHTRFTIKWAVLTSLVVLGAGLLFGIV